MVATPASGVAPYEIEVEISNKQNLLPGYFGLEIRPRTSSAQCAPLTSDGARASSAESSVLATGSYVNPTTVPSGSCQSISVVIRDLRDGSIVSSGYATINNM